MTEQGRPDELAERCAAQLLCGDPDSGDPDSGLCRPFALAGGRAVATWTIVGGQVLLAPFAPLDTPTQAVLAADAIAVTRFLGVKAPSPTAIRDTVRMWRTMT